MDQPIKDPYRDCESGRCNHDLVRGVGIEDLLDDDGPYPPTYLIVNLASARPSLFDAVDDLREAG